MRRRILAFLSLMAMAPEIAFADELRKLVAVSAKDVIPDPPVPVGCAHPPTPANLRAARLIVRDSERRDVGPYTVTLPGYATEDDPKSDSYTPLLINATPGDTLRFDLINRLSDAQKADTHINLHTHGLIVSPRPEHPCGPAGDNIFTDIPQSNSVSYRIDIPRELPASLFGGDSKTYPTGLYWFHAHIHGSAKNQVAAGQAGILSIEPSAATGDASATASDASTSDALAALYRPQPNLRTRYLALQEIQLAVDADATPDKPALKAPKADWINGDKFDTQGCRAKSNDGVTMLTAEGAGEGFCGHTGIYDDPRSRQPVAGDTRATVWLFTINGQRYPDITVSAGQSELWRVANLSATVTYVIDLVDANGTRQDLHLVTLDGVVAGSPDPRKAGHSKIGVKLQQLLLMPASRAEILIQNTAAGGADRSLTLRTEGIETAGTDQKDKSAADYVGDPWPAVKLAQVTLKGASQAGPLESLLDVALPDRSAELGGAAELRLARRAANPAVPPNCVVLPDRNYRRRITFAQTDADFRLGSDVVNADGQSIDDPASNDRPHTIDPQIFSHALPPEAVRHICPRFGETEVWELVNSTPELHNFHIHQSKFRLADSHDPGAPPGLTVETAWRDPGRVVIGQIADLQTVRPVNKVDVWHDTIPIPPRDKLGNPGVVFVAIPFRAREQIGTYVFHCHILEHEDGGMMATVQVFDPLQWSSVIPPVRAAQSANTEFCGAPPAELTDANRKPTAMSLFTSILTRLAAVGQ